MNLEQSAEIAEVRLLLRWAGQVLTETQRECLGSFLMGETDSQIARRLGIETQAVRPHRRAALAILKDRLRDIGISSCADLLSTAEVIAPKQSNQTKQPKARAKLDISIGKCKRGHDRAKYTHRLSSGKLTCILCQNGHHKKYREKKADYMTLGSTQDVL
jgi:DNA-binding CsgD family transcriptional regulator